MVSKSLVAGNQPLLHAAHLRTTTKPPGQGANGAGFCRSRRDIRGIGSISPLISVDISGHCPVSGAQRGAKLKVSRIIRLEDGTWRAFARIKTWGSLEPVSNARMSRLALHSCDLLSFPVIMLPLRQIACFGSLVALVSAAPSPKLTERQSGLPSYALTYAPWSYVYSGEQWFPSDIKTHLANTIPEVNFVAIGSQGSATVNNLDTYNTSVYLSEPTPASDSLPFLYSAYGTPDNSTGFSAAPGTIIAVQKNATWVDVFYFYFYSYNYGGKSVPRHLFRTTANEHEILTVPGTGF
jgi:hypothetical protein